MSNTAAPPPRPDTQPLSAARFGGGGDGPILVTGAAGFIGYFLCSRLLDLGLPVVGVDNLNAYYDPTLKRLRLDRLRGRNGFRFETLDIAEPGRLSALMAETKPAYVAHMAAQAGVRYSIENPAAYGSANLVGFLNVLEACREFSPTHLVYASSSSVYGGNATLPYSISASVDHPVSLYAATKKANELMAHSYSHLYGLAATGLRFFTVYGPFGRPDMAYFLFTKAIFEGRPIRVFNHGEVERDFTYIDDIVEGVLRALAAPPAPNPDFDRQTPDPGRSWAPHRVFNIGNHRRERVMRMIDILEAEIGRPATRELLPMQPGDVAATWADVSDLSAAVGFAPDTPLEDGLKRFVAWYRETYRPD